ncbi:DUF6541 family protein [Amnibacterium kyonggiense]|uniref:4-amino-4-deoxy-L-arabinose transferase-like glycosyltransferase n=1 Tax=Amnibacterium kyonggiense TaxID=595671 RepID=A0A4R7FEV4_9MICO|nr:DUF6541 family protein [Amnibacterium kyonggiense]TDS74986.1 hypothetical protein CLV52_3510 [Amnibacterium kyonggiense]
MSWTAVAPPVAVVLAAVFVPGLALAAAARLRGVVALGVAGPLGYAIVGITGVVAGALHAPFGWPALLVVTAVLVVLAVAVRALLRAVGAPVPPWDTWRPVTWVPVVLGAVVATTAITIVAFAHVPSPDRITQTYDTVFHLNAAASIVETGDASSLHLYRLTHPGKDLAFYPAVWHSLTALGAETTGVDIAVAANATWIATAGSVFSLGAAFVSAVVFGRSGLRRDDAPAAQRTVVATVAAVLASTFVAFPYLLLDFGTLYPNGLAYTLLPAGVAIVAALLPFPERAPWRPESPPVRWRTGVLLLAWGGAAAFAHPRSAVALLVLATPMVVAWFAARMSALAATGQRGRRRARITWVVVVLIAAALVAVVTVGVLHYYTSGGRPISDHLNGGPALARESFPQALLQGLLATSLVAPSQAALPPSVLLAVVAFVGLIAALLRPGLRWAVVTYLALVLLYGFAAGSDSDLAKIATGLWDKDKFRIVAILPTIGVPLAAWTITAGAAELTATLRGRTARRQDPRPRTVALVTAGVTAIVAVTAWAGPALGGVSSAMGEVFALPDHQKKGLLLDADEAALLERVGEFVPQGQVIVGNPWNGSALAWALGGRRVLFPHLGGYWNYDGRVIQRHLDDFATDDRVCPAVRAERVRWVITDPGRLAGDRKAASHFSSIDRVVTKPGGAVLVASSGSTKLWRLTACW